jgi:GNAT superfamily N-acetyltransferase
MTVLEKTREGCLLSTDRTRLDVALIHQFLAGSYWAPGIPLDLVRRSIENSLCFGIYEGERQLAFARVVTDYATFGYVSDVFVVASHRGRGLSKWLMEEIRAHPELQVLRRWHLLTADAHPLYQQFGFTELSKPEMHMEITVPDPYRRK